MHATYPAAVALVDGDEVIELRPTVPSYRNPIMLREYDFGAPAVRESTVDREGADGVIDRSAFTGARTATFDLLVMGDEHNSAYTYVERLAAMTHPYRRPKVRVTRNTPESVGEQWEMTLAGGSHSLAYNRQSAGRLEMQLTFNAPDGYFIGPYRTYQSTRAEVISTTGLTMPVTLPLHFGTGLAENPFVTVTVGGSAPVAPVIYLYGPSTNPEIRHDYGGRFKFNGLTIASGSFVQIDMANGTVYHAGVPSSSRFHLVDWSVSSFWRWFPGVQHVRYLASTGFMVVQFRDRRITV